MMQKSPQKDTVGHALSPRSECAHDFGHLFGLIFELRRNGVPLKCINLDYFIEKEREWIKAGYSAEYSCLIQFKSILPAEATEAA